MALKTEGSTRKRLWICEEETQSAKSLILEPKSGSPLLMLSLEGGGCRVYSPEDDRVYETKSDLSGYRFLGNSGKWFLVLDSQSNLSIIDVFSEEKILLPPLESIKGGLYRVERLGDKEFKDGFISNMPLGCLGSADEIQGLLWVNDKTGDYVVVWQFHGAEYLGFCKTGDKHYREILTRVGVRMELRGLRDMVLKGHSLYIYAVRDFIRQLDLSGQDGVKDKSVDHRFPMWMPHMSHADGIERLRGNKVVSYSDNMAVTSNDDVLIVHARVYESTTSLERYKKFHLFKRDVKDLDPDTCNTRLVEVDSLGGDALFVDFGTTVPANPSLGIEPNSIYFTRDHRFFYEQLSRLDICVYNLDTKKTKHFPTLSNFKVKDAFWFLP